MNKIKVRIVEDELYPIYNFVGKDWEHIQPYEISETIINEYKFAEKAFIRARAKLKKAMEKNSNV